MSSFLKAEVHLLQVRDQPLQHLGASGWNTFPHRQQLVPQLPLVECFMKLPNLEQIKKQFELFSLPLSVNSECLVLVVSCQLHTITGCSWLSCPVILQEHVVPWAWGVMDLRSLLWISSSVRNGDFKIVRVRSFTIIQSLPEILAQEKGKW